MAKTLELTFADGSAIHVEGSAVGERSFGEVVDRVTEPFDAAIGTLRRIADGLQTTLLSAQVPPTAVTVQFGLKFDTEYGVVLCKGSVGANLTVTMEWRKA
jgi:hypothetical protein